jgi:hypothetical protein
MTPLSRRQLLQSLAAAGAVTLARPASGALQRDLIKAENDKPGTSDWQLMYVSTRRRSAPALAVGSTAADRCSSKATPAGMGCAFLREPASVTGCPRIGFNTGTLALLGTIWPCAKLLLYFSLHPCGGG